MIDLIDELRERLRSDDDDRIYSVLEDHFDPDFVGSPFVHQWQPRAELELEEGSGSGSGSLKRELIDLANGAQRAWRMLRFRRRLAKEPELPVVVCEGDSWVAHPLIEDITDHLLDDQNHQLHALGVGAAADLLRNMASQAEYREMIDKYDAKALLLSGGGNDLMQSFASFLRQPVPGNDPQRLLTGAVDQRMASLMVTMRTLLEQTKHTVPVVVHGYDHLCARKEPGKGGTLGQHFDTMGIDDAEDRHAVLRLIVDRYNEHLARTVEDLDWVTYVDLRDVVPHGMEPCGAWHDDIHPTSKGYACLAAKLAPVLLELIADG